VSRATSRARELLVPVSVLLTVTHRCQLACAHCYQAAHESDDSAVSTEALVALMDELALLGTLDLTFTGGEALLRKDLFTLIEAARARAFAVTLFTNGGPVTPEVARRLRALRVMRVEVSLHGSHAATHDGFAGRAGAFARAVRAIELLDDAGVPVLVKSNVVKSNAPEIEQLAGLFSARPRVQFMSDVLLHQRDDGAATLSQRASPGQIAGHFDWKAASATDDELQALQAQLAAAPPESAFATRAPCGAGRSYAVIMPDGAVLACTHLDHHPLGSLREKSFSEIWLSSPAAQTLRGLTLERFEECRGCQYRHVCAKCPALSQTESGQLTGHSKQVCDRTKAYWGAIERELAVRAGDLPRLTPPPAAPPPAGPRAGRHPLRVLPEGLALEDGCR
jgi:radical SAM protein with 4Fe4S-binding SPASM domain